MENRKISKLIKHKGIVEEVRQDMLLVAVQSESACSTCHVKGACTVSEVKEKIIEINEFSKTYKKGEEVIVVFKESSGFKALFFGYILPLIIIIVALSVFTSYLKNDGISGLLALAFLVIYYAVLYFFRSHLKKIFKFQLEEA